jgi:HEAT repeat protein
MMLNYVRLTTACLLAAFLPALLAGVSAARAEIRPEFLMDSDPDVQPLRPLKSYAPGLSRIWFEALGRPEADLQRMAADAIERGHRAEVPGLKLAVPRLIELVDSPKSHPTVHVAAVRALVALDARQSAANLAEASRNFGADVRQVAEPALAEWHYDPYIADWEARVVKPTSRTRDLILAIQCLATIGKQEAADRFLELTHEPAMRADVRIAAASAAGKLRDTGLESHVQMLLAGSAPSRVNRLCAVQLLTRHQGAAAQELLLKFAVDEEPAVARVALARLLEIDPHLVLPVAERSMQSPDVHVRRHGSEAYVRLPDPERVAVLTKLLNDPDPELRRSVCSFLLELTQQPALDVPIREAAVKMLAGDQWRGQEQAALLLGSLDHEACAPRLQQLLDSPRAEAEVAAAWAIKSLAISEMLPSLLERGRQKTALRRTAGAALPPGIDKELGHIFELFGKLKYAPSEPLLREHIPKQFELGWFTRSAAVWTLGHLHAGVPDEGLASQYLERMRDIGPPPEMHKVQQMCLIGIGRMKAVSRIPDIREIIPPTSPSVLDSELARWTLMQLTGEPFPELKPTKISISGWFLESLENVED